MLTPAQSDFLSKYYFPQKCVLLHTKKFNKKVGFLNVLININDLVSKSQLDST